MIPEHILHYLATLETAAAMKLKGTKIDTHCLNKKGKLVPLDKAPAQVKARRRRTAGKVTGVRAAK